MKYTRLFNSIATAKAATDLVSPNLTLVKDGNNQKLLSFSDGTIDSHLQITGTSLSDLSISTIIVDQPVDSGDSNN